MTGATMDRLVYIDEEDAVIHKFQREAEGKFDVIIVKPQPDLQRCIDEIHDLRPDAVVSDFNLREYNPDISYSGVDIVEGFHRIRAEFPCFIITSFEGHAAKASEDVNLVYSRSSLGAADDQAEISFFEKVSLQIRNYRNRVAKYSEEHEVLSKIAQSGQLNAEQAERLEELDIFLERIADGRAARPRHLKDDKALNIWATLISEAEGLVQKIRADREGKNVSGA